MKKRICKKCHNTYTQCVCFSNKTPEEYVVNAIHDNDGHQNEPENIDETAREDRWGLGRSIPSGERE